jgi:hypothetical protein
MKERPILFSAPMVRAILEGRKTQVRRVVKPQPTLQYPRRLERAGEGLVGFAWLDIPADRRDLAGALMERRHCPYGQPGDRLWVRETWNLADKDRELIDGESVGPEAPYKGCQGDRKITWVAVYKADFPNTRHPDLSEPRWRPSIHMPRWASRITLEVTGVRVERVQAISEEDAKAEGIHVAQRAAEPGHNSMRQLCNNCGKFRYLHIGTANACPGGEGTCYSNHTYKAGFIWLWEQLNSNRGFGWAVNPWVWVVEFKRIEGDN